MTARIYQFRPEPIDPIRLAKHEWMPPVPSIWLWLLMVLPFWWFVGWLIWSHV